MICKFKQSQKVMAPDVNHQSELSIVGIMCIFEEVVSQHIELMKCDRATIIKNFNVFWVLTKIKLKINKNVKWSKTVEVETWPQKLQPVKFDRDFYIKDESGEVVISGVSEWCILDAQSRRIKRASTISNYPTDEQIYDKHAINEPYFVIKMLPAEMEYVYTHIVRYNDLDMNRHCNNVMYNRFALDVFNIDFFDKYEICDYEIHFVKETREGNNIDIYKKEIDNNKYYIAGFLNEGTEKVFEVMLSVKERD